MSQELIVYDVFQGAQVRQVDRGDGKIWRVLLDCCIALGFRNVSDVRKRIPKQHIALIYLLAPDGRNRKHWIVDEIGLLDVIAYSRLPREQVDAFRELIGQKAVSTLNGHTELLEIMKVMQGQLASIINMQQVDRSRISALELKQGWQELAVTTTTKVNVRREHRTPHIVLDDMVKAHATCHFASDVGYVWHFLTHNYKLDHGRDLYRISKNRSITIQIAAEQEGLLDHLIEYAKELFGRKIIQSEMPF